MSILLKKSTRFIIQGITGYKARFYLEKFLAAGTKIVGGVVPKKQGATIRTLPIFSSIKEAQKALCFEATMVFVPASNAKNAILEAIDHAVPLILCFTEDIPVHDMLLIKKRLQASDSILIGPSSSGIHSPGVCRAAAPYSFYQKGSLALISRGFSLGYEALLQLCERKIGISTHVCIGSDPLVGTTFLDLLPLLEKDIDTKAILILATSKDEKELLFFRKKTTKPVGIYITQEKVLHPKLLEEQGIAFVEKENREKQLEQQGALLVKNLAFLADSAQKLLEKFL